MTSFIVSLKTLDGTCDMVELPMTPRIHVGPKLPPVNKRVNKFSGKYFIYFHNSHVMIFIGKKMQYIDLDIAGLMVKKLQSI
jgi:hypothetical protein